MSRRSLVLATLLVAGLALVPGPYIDSPIHANPVPVTGPYWIATPPLAPPRAPIQLTFWNTTMDTVYVHDTSPYWITDSGGTTVYGGGGAFQVVVPIPPGVMLTWVWGQQDDNGRQVDPGDYVAHIRWGETSNDPNANEETASILVLGDVLWKLDPREIEYGAELTLQLRNLSGDIITLPNDAPWQVVDSLGDTVYTPGQTPSEVTVAPGDSLDWLLDTNLLPPGNATYTVQIAIWSTIERILRHPEDSFRVNDPPGQVFWTVTPLVQATRSAVALTLTNASLDSIWIPHWPAYWIEDPSGTHVYDPWALQALFPIPPGGSVTWGWNETQNDGSYAPPGDYVAKVRYGTQANPNLNQASFNFRLVGPPDCIFVQSTDADHWYGADEDTVHFRFTNCAPDTVGMIAGYTWWIGNVVGFPVDWPEIVLMYMPRFAPLDFVDLEWDEMDRLGDPAPPGAYYAFVSFTDKWYRTHYVVASNPIFLQGGVSDAPPDLPAVPRVMEFSAAPNPFNPNVSLTVELGSPSRAWLEVFDVRGQRLRTLLAGSELPAGRKAVLWDGLDDARRPVPGGAYLFRLVTPNETRTVKAILVK